jgi:hypothetical protein
MNYLIYDTTRNMWWKANRHGYTSNIEEAGRYPFIVAQDICQAPDAVAVLHLPIGSLSDLRQELTEISDSCGYGLGSLDKIDELLNQL